MDPNQNFLNEEAKIKTPSTPPTPPSSSSSHNSKIASVQPDLTSECLPFSTPHILDDPNVECPDVQPQQVTCAKIINSQSLAGEAEQAMRSPDVNEEITSVTNEFTEKTNLEEVTNTNIIGKKDSSAYHLKWITWKGNKCPIITQNENGPCPLIAIMNVLILKGKMNLPPMVKIITANQLMEYLGDTILDSVPNNVPEGVQLNYEQNMHDAIAILPKLQTGLDVNVKFTGIADFEYTPELIVFDLLHIPLYHGWIVDPEAYHVQSAVSNFSYNQIVDRIITNKSSSKPQLVTEALIAEEFLEKTASQLTYEGLSQLTSNVKEGELGILFRNNHFITLFKNKNRLYQLVTDQGFLTENNVIWETLSNIENDGEFVDSNFTKIPPKATLEENSQQQVDQDYLLALSLQEDAKKEEQTEKQWQDFKIDKGMEGLDDEELARRLQAEEERRFKQKQEASEGHNQNTHPQPVPQAQSHSSHQRRENVSYSNSRRDDGVSGRDKNNKNCSIM